MSKVQKKKRVARVNGDAVRDGISDGCYDYVSTIMKNMDYNFCNSVQSNILKIDPKNSEHKDMKEFTPSTSKESTQNASKITSKRFGISRKFPLMEKSQRTLKHIKHNRSIPKQRAHLATLSVPPMKKNIPRNNSGVFMQIKNRNKQNLKNKKSRSVLQGENSAGVTIKNKNIPQNKKSASSSTFYESDENSGQTTVGCSKRYNYRGTNDNLNNSMNVVDDSNSDTTDGEYEKFIKKNKKFLKSKQKSKNSVKPAKKARKNTALHKTSFPSDSDSSDDTYHKTDSLNIGKDCKIGTKAGKNKVLRKISKLSYSDSSDDVLYHKTHKTNSLKVSKDCEIETKDSESDIDLVNCETDTRDCEIETKDSESDIDLVNCETYTRDCEIETKDSESDIDLVNCETYTRDSSESDVADFEEQFQDSNNSELVEQQNKNEEYCLTPESQLPSVKNNFPDTYSDYIFNDDSLVSTKSFEQNNPSDISLSFDTATSSNNCRNMSHDFNVLSSTKKEDTHVINISQNIDETDHEESDIEFLEIVIVPKTKNRKVGNISADNSQCVINDSMNTNLNKANSQSSVKNKELQNCQIEDEKHNKQYSDEKYEAVYITDICKEEIESKVNILKQPTLNSNFNVSEVSVSHNKNKLICEVKKEDSDDDIIFECVVPAKNRNEKCASAASSNIHKERTLVKAEITNSFISNKIPSVKAENSCNNLIGISKGDSSSCSNSETFDGNENVSLAKELKLYEVACSNLAHTTNISSKMLDKLSPEEPVKENIDIKHLVELFKKEFQVYQEIVQTEASVEASLKLLETRQAEKLQAIRSLISDNMGKKQCNTSNINEQINFLYKTQSNAEASSKEISEDFKHAPLQKQKTTGITSLLQDECSIHSQKIVLPSPVLDKDIKPNLSVLENLPMSVPYQHSLLKPKSEPNDSSNTSNKNTFTLLGEKCNLCGKEAVAACQRCAKVFFCSNECGKKFWIDGHENDCVK